MVRPDLVVTWPRHIDYPLFRYNLLRFKPYFNATYIALTDHGMLEDYSNFLINNIDARFKKIPRGEGDWRSNAVNELLKESEASHVLFMEQDFLIRDDRFFEVILNVSDYNFLYYDEQGRIHPACALVPRHIIDETSKDFAARPPAYDHFGLFFNEVLRKTNSADLETIGLHDGEDFWHLAGLTQNYHAQPFFKPQEFLTYNLYAQDLPVSYNEFALKMARITKDNPIYEVNPVVVSMFPIQIKEAS